MKSLLRRLVLWLNDKIGPDPNSPVRFYPFYDLVAQDMPIIPSSRFSRGWVAEQKKRFKELAQAGPTGGKIPVSSTFRCPALVTFFSAGYILRAHRDFCIYTSGDIENPKVFDVPGVSKPDPNSNLSYGFITSTHPFGPDMLTGIHRPYPERTPNAILKLEAAWTVVAPRDVILLIAGVPLADNNDFTLVSGFLDTQIETLLQPLIWWHHHDRKDVYIKKGTPILQIIPISRSDLNRAMQIVTDPELRRQERQFSEEVRYLRDSQFLRNYGRIRKSADAYQARLEGESGNFASGNPLHQNKSKCPFSFLWSK